MDPITIALQSKGVNEVKAALRGIHEAIEQIDKVSASAGKDAFAARLRGIKKELGAGQVGSNRAPMVRVFGNDSAASVRRVMSGPPLSAMPGAAGTPGMSSMLAKAGAAGAAFAILKGAIDFAADSLKQFGGFLIADVIKPAFALETAAQQLSNSSGGTVSAQEIQDKTRAAALKHNMDPNVLLEAASKMIDLTGDAKTSFSLLDTIGTLSKSRGADAGELADFAATLKNFDPNASAEQISSLLMTQLAQGDKGSVPLKEAARLGGRLTAPAAFLAGNTDVKMASMGALMQSARKGFGSTDELATGIGNLINEVSSQKMVGSKKYLNKDGQIGDVASLIGGILKDTGGDAKKIGALGLSDPASKLVKAYLPAFNDAGKGDKGKEAIESLIRSFMEASTTLDAEKANERKVLQTSGEQWSATIALIQERMLEVLPQVKALVSSLAEKGPAIASAAMLLADVLIGLAEAIEKLIPSTDTRTKKKLAKARDEQRLNSDIADNAQQVSALDEQIAGRTSARKFQPSELLGSFDDETEAMKRKRSALIADRSALGARKDKLAEPEKQIDHGAAVAALMKGGKDASLAESMIKGIEKAPDEYDIDSGALTADLGADIRATLSTFRDQQLDRRDKNVEGGAKSGISDAFLSRMDASSEKLAKSADALERATGQASRTTPIGQR